MLRFSVDAIYPVKEGLFGARLIPDINSKYFPPQHLKRITFTADLLEEEFYRKYHEGPKTRKTFKGAIVQGGYYEIPKRSMDVKTRTRSGEEQVITEDLFTAGRMTSPYDDKLVKKRDLRGTVDVEELADDSEDVFGKVFLHGFDVGQGDSLLLIANNGNAYLIDTNIYSDKRKSGFYKRLKNVLDQKDVKLKGLIVTHKHLDHIRGADVLLNDGKIKFEYLIINNSYKHPTKTAARLIKAAGEKIPKTVNADHKFTFQEGDTEITVFNPTVRNNSKKGAPDINDSSICLCIKYGDTRFVLTGDAGHEFITKGCPAGAANDDSVLKVSHHGSRTGTDDKMMKSVNPGRAFISVGYKNKHHHPHDTAMNALKTQLAPNRIKISHKIKRTTSYVSDGKSITVS